MQNKHQLLQVGDSFLLRDDHIGSHLHVIVAEMSGEDDGQVMLVYVTDSNSYKDNTTVILPGEHKFINNESWVKYQNVIICNRSSLAGNITAYYGKVSDSLLKRVQDGILKSKRTEKWKKELFKSWRLNHLFDQL